MSDTLEVPQSRREPLARIAALLLGARRVVLTTHVNADGDGAGSEAAVAAWLVAHGVEVRIANPTGFPDVYRYLVPAGAALFDPGEGRSLAAGEGADVVAVLDTSEAKRIGRIGALLDGRQVALIDHHPPVENGIRAEAALQDPAACATGELIFDLLRVAQGDAPWVPGIARALYAAIVTDTGSFRFSNTTPRAHAIAAELLRRGVDPEEEYRRLYGRVPYKRLHLLRAVLERLAVDPDLPIAWISIPRTVMTEFEASSEDLEGLIDYARDIENTEVALLFRETVEGGTKVSLRSNGIVDVNAIARQFGGGGHIKASGILMGAGLESARTQVLEATRLVVRRVVEAARAAGTGAPPAGNALPGGSVGPGGSVPPGVGAPPTAP